MLPASGGLCVIGREPYALELDGGGIGREFIVAGGAWTPAGELPGGAYGRGGEPYVLPGGGAAKELLDGRAAGRIDGCAPYDAAGGGAPYAPAAGGPPILLEDPEGRRTGGAPYDTAAGGGAPKELLVDGAKGPAACGAPEGAADAGLDSRSFPSTNLLIPTIHCPDALKCCVIIAREARCADK